MNLIIISQDKKAMWDCDQTLIAIRDKDIVIRPYNSDGSFILGHYKSKKKTQQVFDNIIKIVSINKLLLKPEIMLPLKELSVAKKYFEKLNGIKLVATDSNFDILPINNNGTLVYQLPEDDE